MPNWKSYDSSVRLLSAVIAAHPELKLNYGDIAKFYGDQTKYKAMWNRFAPMRAHAEAQKLAVAAGVDPSTVEFLESGKEIAKCFGGGVSTVAAKHIFDRHLKFNVKLIREAVAQGRDPFEIPDSEITLGGGVRTLKSDSEISRCMGDDVTKIAIETVFKRYLRPDAKRIQDILQAGGNPGTLSLSLGPGPNFNGRAIHFTHHLAKAYGHGTTTGGLSKHFQRHINPGAKLLRDALEKGEDTSTVKLACEDEAKLHKHFGSDATQHALEIQFSIIRSGPAKQVRDFVAAGGDPKDLELTAHVKSGKGAMMLSLFCAIASVGRFSPRELVFKLSKYCSVANNPKEIARIMGSDVTPNGLKFQFTDRYRPLAKRQLEMLAEGGDPKDVTVEGGAKEIANMFGSDSTKGGIEFQFRTFKSDAKRQRDCFRNGGDPKTLNIGGGNAIALHLDDDTTEYALQHRFRAVKKDAENMKAAVAEKFGSGATDGAAAAKTPNGRKPKAAATPKKTGSEDDGSHETPSKKKGALNKVANGRVAKTPGSGRGKKAALVTYEVDEEENVKAEPEQNEHFADAYQSPHQDGNGVGYENGFEAGEESGEEA